MENRPLVGLGLLVVKNDQILLGKRRGSHGEGQFGGPGGHLESGESIEACILRELAEESGAEFKVKNLGFLCLTNLVEYMPKHYVDIGLTADWDSGEPKVMEPEKLEHWGWYDFDNLPSPLFAATANYVEAYLNGEPFFDNSAKS